jgi:hypothetical protein
MNEYDVAAKPPPKPWCLDPGAKPVDRKYSTKPASSIAASTSEAVEFGIAVGF